MEHILCVNSVFWNIPQNHRQMFKLLLLLLYTETLDQNAEKICSIYINLWFSVVQLLTLLLRWLLRRKKILDSFFFSFTKSNFEFQQNPFFCFKSIQNWFCTELLNNSRHDQTQFIQNENRKKIVLKIHCVYWSLCVQNNNVKNLLTKSKFKFFFEFFSFNFCYVLFCISFQMFTWFSKAIFIFQ